MATDEKKEAAKLKAERAKAAAKRAKANEKAQRKGKAVKGSAYLKTDKNKPVKRVVAVKPTPKTAGGGTSGGRGGVRLSATRLK
jgi:hypothetical protein